MWSEMFRTDFVARRIRRCAAPHAAYPTFPHSYFDCPYVVEFEFDKACAERYRASVDALITGDQGKVADLQQAVALGPFDIIIDDGGHTVSQQITTLVTLFPALSKGGLFFVEDL